MQHHSHCIIRFNDGSLQDKLQNKVSALQHNIRALRDGVVTGTTARFNRAMAYRAIRPLARFHEGYRAVDEILLNSETLEASSRLNFKEFPKDGLGIFHTHPGLIDGLIWAGGFSMNCNDWNDLDKDVFVNHGWQSFQIFQPLDFAKEYTTYSRMVEGKDRLWRGEVTILEGNSVVAHFENFAVSIVPRIPIQGFEMRQLCGINNTNAWFNLLIDARRTTSCSEGHSWSEAAPAKRTHAPRTIEAIHSSAITTPQAFTWVPQRR